MYCYPHILKLTRFHNSVLQKQLVVMLYSRTLIKSKALTAVSLKENNIKEKTCILPFLCPIVFPEWDIRLLVFLTPYLTMHVSFVAISQPLSLQKIVLTINSCYQYHYQYPPSRSIAQPYREPWRVWEQTSGADFESRKFSGSDFPSLQVVSRPFNKVRSINKLG